MSRVNSTLWKIWGFHGGDGFLSQQFMEAFHLLPQETSRTWRQIYKATQSCTCGNQLQGQWVYTHPIALTFPPSDPIQVLASYLLTSTDPSSPFSIYSLVPTLPSPQLIYSWEFSTGGLVCSHLLTLVPRSRIFLPWRWRRYVPPKRRFNPLVLHGATFQKTAFFSTLWVYVIPNVHITEISYAVPREASYLREDYVAAKERIFTTFSKEPLEKFLAWAKIKRA
jgi:hypothetical protein